VAEATSEREARERDLFLWRTACEGARPCRHKPSPNGQMCERCGLNKAYWNVPPPPRFSTDAVAMVRLIEAMRAKGWGFMLTEDGPDGEEWKARFWRDDCDFERDGPTPMVAVAAAAAAALRDEGE
jgi:hypothetical protein